MFVCFDASPHMACDNAGQAVVIMGGEAEASAAIGRAKQGGKSPVLDRTRLDSTDMALTWPQTQCNGGLKRTRIARSAPRICQPIRPCVHLEYCIYTGRRLYIILPCCIWRFDVPAPRRVNKHTRGCACARARASPRASVWACVPGGCCAGESCAPASITRRTPSWPPPSR